MKIHTLSIDIKEQLLIFISEGFSIIECAFADRNDQKIFALEAVWITKVIGYFNDVFPTSKETNQFLHTPYTGLIYAGMDAVVQEVVNRTDNRVQILERILDKLDIYYQFEPESLNLVVQDIDSFSQVRGVNHRAVEGHVHNGFFNKDEESIKRAFAEIIGESFVPNDHGGETEDLYTSRIRLNGQRVRTSIIFNGPGKVRTSQTRTKDLGAGGDQLERMMRTDSSKLYILQSVKPIAQDIVNTFEVFIKDQRSKGNHCYYCIIDGQDTAEILYAYGY